VTSPVCGAVHTRAIGTPVNPCGRGPDHEGDHSGYAPVVDEWVSWPQDPTPYWKLREDPTWRPYCLNCRSMARMTREGDTFRCEACQMRVDVDMRPIREFKEPTR
jgi:hypothetical protein